MTTDYLRISRKENSHDSVYQIIDDQSKPADMKIASILSDLTSLQVCDHTAALALVTAKPLSQSSPSSSKPVSSLMVESEGQRSDRSVKGTTTNDDSDLCRATDLLELHYGVKMKHVRGEEKGLIYARQEVEGVLEMLKRQRKENVLRK